MKAVYAISLLAAAASAMTFKTDPFWKAYKATFGKTYEHDAEEERRYEVFNKNMAFAAELNADPDDAEYGMTHLSDRFPEEVFTKVDFPVDVESEPEPTEEQVAALPASFDARKKKWVPAVRNQGQCGSCWAFAAAGAMSIGYAKKHKKTPPVLSEQQLVDCDKDCYGCNGGLAYYAALYAKKGIMLNSAYPYKARKGSCKFNAKKVKAKVSSATIVAKSVNGIKQTIVKNGACAVSINANKILSYKKGIVSASNCPTSPNHAVVAIGWGKSGSTKYWIIRNSWGKSWGESGYFRMVMGKNACGINTRPVSIVMV